MGFPGGSDGKESTCNAGNPGSISRSGRSPARGNGYPLQYSYLENSMNRGAWRATVYGVTKSQTRLSDWHFQDQFLSPGTPVLSQNCTKCRETLLYFQHWYGGPEMASQWRGEDEGKCNLRASKLEEFNLSAPLECHPYPTLPAESNGPVMADQSSMAKRSTILNLYISSWPHYLCQVTCAR